MLRGTRGASDMTDKPRALDYGQPLHPAETSERHVLDYAPARPPFPVWRLVFLLLACFLGLNYLASRFAKPVPPPTTPPTPPAVSADK